MWLSCSIFEDMTAIRVLIVEDEPLIAEDIADCLSASGFEVAQIIHEFEEAWEFIDTGTFDIALLDITLGKEQRGLELAAKIHALGSKPFCFLSSHTDKGTLAKARETFPASYLLKPFREEELIMALELATATFFQNRSVELTLDLLNQNIPVGLSEREYDVLAALRRGKTNKAISEDLFISVNTVKTHLMNIFTKLDVVNRTELLFKIESFSKRM